MPAKPTGCIILSPPCACRCIVIATFGYAYRFTVMHMVRSIPCRCYLSEKKNGLIQHAEQVVFAYVTDVLDMFPLHEPESWTINCMQLSSFYAKRKSPSDQVWKQSERLLTNIYNRVTMKHDIAIALSQSGAYLTSLMMGCIWIGVHLHPV